MAENGLSVEAFFGGPSYILLYINSFAKLKTISPVDVIVKIMRILATVSIESQNIRSSVEII
jgi:hypothetical protein